MPPGRLQRRSCGGSSSRVAAICLSVAGSATSGTTRLRSAAIFDHVPIARNAVGADVIEQQPHFHPTGSGLSECFEEVTGRSVPAHDVELDVHVSFGGA